MNPSVSRRYSEAEYLSLIASSDLKFEYWDGELVAMAGGQRPHAQIEFNLAGQLWPQLERSSCEGYGSSMAVYLAKSNAYVFPDLTIVCGSQQIVKHQGIDCLENPTIVIEVLSQSTSHSDHGRKLHAYTKVKSICQYIIIDSEEALVTQYSRASPDEIWRAETFTGFDQSLSFLPCPASMTLGQIYHRVQLCD